jgi:beta-1,2-mannobiose phosphorylase / 1,2-beta-oligomannan phosphorylase
MITLDRIKENPILSPNPENEWESEGAFNGCVAYGNGMFHMVYRAFSSPKKVNGVELQVSSIGYAQSKDGIKFTDHRMLLAPTEDWEIYGAEDPRITLIDGKFYIFYTALSVYPFAAHGIKNAVAITTDFQSFEKHQVTTFNSKAMALFPERINGKLAALLTANTDNPPAKIAFASFEQDSDIWSPFFWTHWFENVNSNTIHLLRDMRDQVELGAPPIKTEAGWLVIHSYIKNYMSDEKIFGIEAVLLDIDDPRQIIGRTEYPLITPVEKYELEGVVENVIFPSGALVKDDLLYVYYGAADTTTAVATCSLKDLLSELKPVKKHEASIDVPTAKKFVRYEGNPILVSTPELEWQSLAVFNPAVIYEDGKVHILYRAQGKDGTSYVGYASSRDGFRIDENLAEPIYVPRADFEKKIHEEGNSGCEDPRITKIGDRIYMTYTAYDGVNPPRVAMTSIAMTDFLAKNWNWEWPKLISPPGIDDKDACIVKSINGEGYIAFHRMNEVIWLDFLKDLDFPESKYLAGGVIAQSRKDKWDNVKLGIAGPPVETEKGWLLFYHAVSDPEFKYKVGAMLLDSYDPRIILARTDEPLFEPEEPYEIEGQVPNVVFPCGQVVIDGVVYLYYGGADSVVGVATMPLDGILSVLLDK